MTAAQAKLKGVTKGRALDHAHGGPGHKSHFDQAQAQAVRTGDIDDLGVGSDLEIRQIRGAHSGARVRPMAGGRQASRGGLGCRQLTLRSRS